MNKYQNVFSPLRIGNVEVKNRIELAPSIPILASPDGYVTREQIEHFRLIARGGTGIVNIGSSAIDFEYGKDHEAQLNLSVDKVIPGLTRLVEAIQRYGAKASIQISHPGRFAAPRLLIGKKPIAPSPIPSRAEDMFYGEEGRRKVHVQEMNRDMIDQVIDSYATACYRCLMSGFEIVGLQGGLGLLLAQFLSPYSNKRTDDYGGSLENRAKFPIEVLAAIRKRVGNKLAIEYRISATELVPGGMEVEETIEFIKMIQDKIDLIDIIVGVITEAEPAPHMIQPTYFPHAYNVSFAEKVKKAVGIPVAVSGSISDLETADRIIGEGKADIVQMARALFADPEIVNKTRRGELEEIRPCVRCNSCVERVCHFYPIQCAINPVIGRAVEFGYIRPAEKEKKVVIVGGGPAGMEAAQIASSRGHQVTLYEKEEKLGGMLHFAAALPFKADMKRYLDWMIKTTERHPVEVKLSTEATADTIKAEKPDVLLLAVGAAFETPDIPGATKTIAFWAGDVVMGAEVGEMVAVIGAGLTGCETALHLAQQGKKVTIIYRRSESEIAHDVPIMSKLGLLELLHKHGVEIKTELKLEEVTDQGVLVIDKQWQRYEIAADTVVFAVGLKAQSETVRALEGLAREVYVIGDCADPRNLMHAIHDGFNVAVDI